jgi:pSer/pThr/pTyr-binding forkhead associated (FHA) protein
MTSSGLSDNRTDSTIPPDMRKQLQEASKTIRLDSHEFELEPRSSAGNVLLKSHTTVIFSLVGRDIFLPIHIRNRVTIGRLDFDTTEKADIDLMAYGARDQGVSRCHAALYRTGHTVFIVDLDSSNGTYLNGIKLLPHQPRLLREGDEVHLSKMHFRVHFEL